MNKNWDTPPGGDFAAYVERLTARSERAVLSPVVQPSQEFDPGDDENDQQQASRSDGASAQFGRTLSPGQMPPQKSLTSGLTAALGALRESLERSARNAQQRKKP
ncbi:hypothetical protein QTH91_22875 [Variovorax dokdonensis]|uniref:Uncharacterized protein n=1 Tax=Variovorax dokdonensis TaxID=344883 RepID=A0ABT7NHB2_9BURK|nr:hypothetical protein [Variovorax dokdonensis]MDM0047353.1 hypothetical protein [Variovorax dokdonensis]